MWDLPKHNLLSKSPSYNETEDIEAAARQAEIIEEKSEALGARLNIDFDDGIQIAPQVISYFCTPAEGVLARNLPRLEKDLQLELGCESIKIHAPSPGTKYVKIEIPNQSRRAVTLGDIL